MMFMDEPLISEGIKASKMFGILGANYVSIRERSRKYIVPTN